MLFGFFEGFACAVKTLFDVLEFVQMALCGNDGLGELIQFLLRLGGLLLPVGFVQLVSGALLGEEFVEVCDFGVQPQGGLLGFVPGFSGGGEGGGELCVLGGEGGYAVLQRGDFGPKRLKVFFQLGPLLFHALEGLLLGCGVLSCGGEGGGG